MGGEYMPNELTADEIIALADKNIIGFYDRRIEAIKKANIDEVLKRKNPYLYKALGFTTAEEIVRELLTAYSISSYEGIFGDGFFEPLAEELCGGIKSVSKGTDIEVDVDGIRTVYAIKSGTNVFNSSSKSAQITAFNEARKRLQKNKTKSFDPVVGYGYGNKNSNGGNSNFREVSGQALWKELSGNDDCYLEIAKFSDEVVAQKKAEFNAEFENLIQKSIQEFNNMFCIDGQIDWEKWIKYNSAIKCKKLNITTTKKTICQDEDLELDISVELENEQQYCINTDDNELSIDFESKNITIENNKISICNGITEKEVIKIIFLYRHKSKTIKITIKPKKVKVVKKK